MRGHTLQRVRRFGRKWWCAALLAGVAVAPTGPTSHTDGARVRRRTRGFVALAVSVVLGASGVAAQCALAAGTPFQRGDVFLTGSGGAQEYTPTGQVVQTIPGTAGATNLCFDPSGKHLIVPGAGLFDNAGNLLSSNWAAVTNDGSDCVADGFGNVYTSTEMPDSSWIITKYDLNGTIRQTFPIAFRAATPLAMDLAPDECTMYYVAFATDANGMGPFNVCTKTQGSTKGWDLNDDIRVLPNWQLLRLYDNGAGLFDTSGQLLQSYSPPDRSGHLRTMSLDPDGTSFWMCCELDPSSTPNVFDVWRFDISSGRLLAHWPASGSVAVYSPPLLGDADVKATIDSDAAGRAEAFRTRVRYSGQLTRLHLYVDSSSTASQVVVGIYSDRKGDPGALQRQATISNNLRAGSWNYVDIPSMPVTAGQRYWIAVLGPKGGGTIRFRDRGSGGGRSEASTQKNLNALPPQWSAGTGGDSAPLSAYGS